MQLVGNSTKAGRLLQWRPEVEFRDLVVMMVNADLGTPGAADSSP
jgi:GDP-D-mannose dehydratase